MIEKLTIESITTDLEAHNVKNADWSHRLTYRLGHEKAIRDIEQYARDKRDKALAIGCTVRKGFCECSCTTAEMDDLLGALKNVT